ncbi:disks large 1 tumor suppressor protein-like protein [Willisornis vidua]|uniref:Disks large 1 tumor suppressor protein-like protein n=1 Tax=Willisornis vidua TaxID=1566151 RepID=A0ABQ9CR39_9PASS|nr:disks large 1 tumor suppressor protein-like protein [Willisornis vidua]
MGFYVVNAITVNCKIVQLSAETTDNGFRYQNIDAIVESSQDIKQEEGVVARYIQEFYEVTLLNSQKSYEQKIEEANQVAEKWEKTTTATDHENLQKKQEPAASNGSEGSGQCGEHNKENPTFENYVVDMKTKVHNLAATVPLG